MGGNGSYSTWLKKIPLDKQTHITLEKYRIEGHKILVCEKTPNRAKIPMNCNTANQVYIIASKLDNGETQIASIAIYDGHHISKTIDFEYDEKGNIIPYANDGIGTSHTHLWKELHPGIWGRDSKDKINHLPFELDIKMAKSIVEFNNKHYKYDGLTKHKKS